MIEKKLWELIGKLLQETVQGNIKWERTTSRAAFQTAFPKFSVRIVEVEGEAEGQPDYLLSLIDETGRSIERITDVELRKALAFHEMTVDTFGPMKELYTLARRQAFGVETAIDEILKAIHDSDLPF